jgi:uncharacterized protein (DUF2249 family)/hemerythrin-like domain-containing protein
VSKVTDLIRKHHRQLGETLTGRAQALMRGTDPDPDSFVGFLKNELLTHAAGEEQALYPLMDRLVREHGKPTATMTVDHLFINAYVDEIAKAAARLKQASPSERPEIARRLGELALRLDGIVELHTEKEERVYLPLFERYLSEAEQQKVLEELHSAAHAEHSQVEERSHGGCCGHHHSDPATFDTTEPLAPAGPGETLDVRRVSPPQRHPLIFNSYLALGPSQYFELVNDHDPRPLYYQFQSEHPGEFTWECVEQGPQVWRVRIGRTG